MGRKVPKKHYGKRSEEVEVERRRWYLENIRVNDLPNTVCCYSAQHGLLLFCPTRFAAILPNTVCCYYR